jgi:hypothetical protein
MMNRAFLMSLGVILLGTGAYADTTPSAMCTPFPTTFNNGAGASSVSCPPFSVPGATLTGVTLSYLADYQFGSNPGPNTANVVFTPAGPAGVTWSPSTQTLSPTGGVSSGSVPAGGATATTGISTAAFSAAFNVNISSSVSQGTVATSSGAASVVYTFTPPPAINLTCPSSTGEVGVPYNSALIATGGVPAYTFSITVGALPPVLNLNMSTGGIAGTPTTPGPFSFTAKVVDSTGTAAGTTTANCVITISAQPPPPPPNMCNASAPVFAAGAPADAFQVRYAANLDIGDSVVDITNSGTSGVAGNPAGGNLCVNVYTFDAAEEMISCCACAVTPNGLQSLSVRNSLISNPLTPAIPSSVVIKLVATVPATGALAGGMRAWGTTLHALPTTPVSFGLAETPFVNGGLSATELTHITSFCGFIQQNGSGFGICKGCAAGGLGASTSSQ